MYYVFFFSHLPAFGHGLGGISLPTHYHPNQCMQVSKIKPTCKLQLDYYIFWYKMTDKVLMSYSFFLVKFVLYFIDLSKHGNRDFFYPIKKIVFLSSKYEIVKF